MSEIIKNEFPVSDENISNVERILSILIGMGLGYRGVVDLQEDNIHGVGYLATGAVLMARGITGKTVKSMISKTKTIL